MFWTTHIDSKEETGNPSPVVAVGNKIYSFGWISNAKQPTEATPLQVHLLNADNRRWSKISPDELQSSGFPKHRIGHSAVVHEKKIYIWGGIFGDRYFDELLCLDTVSFKWNVIQVSGIKPQTRFAHFAFVIDHSMYLLGGYNARTKKYSPDFFALDLNVMKWEYIAAPSLCPYMWEGISACAAGRRIYIFGGEMYRSHWNGGSFFDTVTRVWRRIVICESCPLMWKSPAFVYDNSIYVFDGTCSNKKSNIGGIRLWKLSTETNRWIEVLMLAMSESPLTLHGYVVVNFRVFVFGNKCRYRINNTDLHIIDFDPTLQSRCLRVMVRNKLDISNLPYSLRSEVTNICVREL